MRMILLFVVALVQYGATAHNPLTAKFELNTNFHQGALMNINLSQTGLHQALLKYYEQTDFEAISVNEYKLLAVEYLKEHIHILANRQLLKLGEGAVKLGSHQTDFKFLIGDYPSAASILSIHIDAFKENEDHHTAFWWTRSGKKTKAILSAANDFQATLSTQEEVSLAMVSSNSRMMWGGLIGVLLLSFLFIRHSFNVTTVGLVLLIFSACSPKTSAPEMTQQNNPPPSDRHRKMNQEGRRERPQFADLLAKMDADKDGRLSSKEIQGPLKNDFSKVDINKDGYISEEEFKSAPPPRHRRN